MENIAGHKSSLSWAVNISVIVLIVLRLIPTVGLFV
jgi:alpha-glucoside transport system permease protein